MLALFDLANHVARRGERLAGVAGLTTQQWLVLLQVAHDPNFPSAGGASDAPVLASDIARARGVSRATISTIVSALKRRGLIREEVGADDARRRHLEVTEAGAAAIEAIQPARQAANQRLLGALPAADRARFLRYLRGCLDVLWEAREDEQVAVAQRKLAGKRARP